MPQPSTQLTHTLRLCQSVKHVLRNLVQVLELNGYNLIRSDLECRIQIEVFGQVRFYGFYATRAQFQKKAAD